MRLYQRISLYSVEYVLDLTQLTTIFPPYQFFNSYHLALWFYGWLALCFGR